MNQPNACVHTPAPWIFDGDNPSNQGFDIAFPESGALATAYYCFDGEGRETAEANARLIAAAPELLEVCTIALACLENAVNGCTWKDGEHLVAAEQAIAIIQKIITKATGEKS